MVLKGFGVQLIIRAWWSSIKMEDLIDDDTEHSSKQLMEANSKGYTNILQSPSHTRPNFRIFIGLIFYFVAAFIISDFWVIPAVVIEEPLFSMSFDI